MNVGGKARSIAGWIYRGAWLGLLVAGAVYLLADYVTLRDWYPAGGPVYRADFWAQEYFTPRARAWGNYFVAGGMALAVAGLLLGPPPFPTRRPRIRPSAPGAWLLVALGVLWVWAQWVLPVTFDEAFSAVHFSGVGGWRSLSYYALPNNHVLFNLLNSAPGRLVGDPVLTGRLLGLLSYLALGAGLYHWLRGGVEHGWPRALLVALVMSPLAVWGFAAQARGYALLLTVGWVAVVGLAGVVRGARETHYWMYVVGSVAGFVTVPSFLLVFPALPLYWVGHCLRRGGGWRGWLVANGAVAALTYLGYLPALAFSGVGALVDNPYVRAAPDFGAFAARLPGLLVDYADYAFAGLTDGLPGLGVALLLLPPVALLLRPRPFVWRFLAGLQLVLLPTVAITILLLRAVPFHRTLVLPMQLGWLLLAGLLLNELRRPLAVVSLAALFAANLWLVPPRWDPRLYYYPVHYTDRKLGELLDHLPPGAPVRYADEAFLPRVLGHRRGHPPCATDCRYLIRADHDAGGAPGPPWREVAVATAYRLYERR